MSRFSIILFTTVVLVLSACEGKQAKQEKAIMKIPLSIHFDRFERSFYEDSTSIQKLKINYPYFFSNQLTNKEWEKKRKDTLLRELYDETVKTFEDFDFYKKEIIKVFKRMRYYFPEFKVPEKVVTLVSEVDYLNKIVLTDSLMVICLDTYLGSNHKFYGGIYNYLAQNLKKEQLLPDIAEQLALTKITDPEGRTFLDYLIFHGKIKYLKQLLLPDIREHEILSYTEKQLKWIHHNAVEIWKYFIREKLFFSTDKDLLERFIKPGPYSRFYLSIDYESPPRIGIWLGYELVKAYVAHEDISLNKLLQTTTSEIFNRGHYKPERR